MPETKTKRRPAANKKAATRKPRVAQSKLRVANDKEHDPGSAAKRTTELSDDVLKSLDDGARSAIDAVRKFVETVDRALPLRGEGPSKREEITDSALEMAQRLVHTQSDFLRKVVDSAGRSLSRSDDAK
jgi:tRNA(Ser,Leu) C12 N-acetylase TAN1